jgi:hypothetical protein
MRADTGPGQITTNLNMWLRGFWDLEDGLNGYYMSITHVPPGGPGDQRLGNQWQCVLLTDNENTDLIAMSIGSTPEGAIGLLEDALTLPVLPWPVVP